MAILAPLPSGMSLTAEHEAFRAKVRRFLDERVEPLVEAYEAAERFPREILEEMGARGFLGAGFPREYGGGGGDSLYAALLVEEASRVWGSLGIILAAHLGLGTAPIATWGTEEQKRRYLPDLLAGRSIGGYGLTEPQAGSDSGATQTRARREGDHWVLDGTKAWCTNASQAHTYIVSAVTDPERGKKGISAFIVEDGFPGFSCAKLEDKLGLRASATGVLVFEGCRVPAGNLLGERGQGFRYFMQTLDGGRITIGAMALGLAQGALDAVMAQATREDLTGDLFAHEYRLAPLAEMGSEIAAARHMVYHAALQKDRLPRWTLEGAMAKWFASEVAMRVTSRAVEMLGIAGLRHDSAVSRAFRDAKLCTIGEGTNEIQRVVIAREMLKRCSTS